MESDINFDEKLFYFYSGKIECLDGPDPPSDRPKLLHVQVRGFQTVDISKIAELFAGYGAVDVKQFTRYRALVAVGNHV
ncbi:hypothetical protein Cfor_08891, partial [Coptotermes formosanus]